MDGNLIRNLVKSELQRKITSKKNLTCIQIMGKPWEPIGEILKNKNRKTTVTDTCITYNCMPCTDNTDIANNFNTYFTTVGNTLAANVPIAKVICQYKTKDPALLCNYRPISLLPFFSKILERLMYNRLHNLLTFSPSHLSASTLRSVPARIMTCQCLRSPAISVVIWFLAISSFTRSRHLSFGLPRFLFPSTSICNIFLVA